MKEVKYYLRIFLGIINVAMVILLVLRGIVSINPFFAEPNIEFDSSEISIGSYEKIAQTLKRENPNTLDPCHFSIGAFLNQFIGYEQYEINLYLKYENDFYDVILDRSGDSSDRHVFEYKIDQNFNLISKGPMKMPIF
jgi:hypothetical protein